MDITLINDKTITKLGVNGLKISMDNGKTWQSFGYRPEDAAVDCMYYFATEIVDADGHIHKIDREKPIKKAFNDLEGDDCCGYCRYQDECHGMTSNGRGEPIYPACADALEPNDYMDYEKFKKDYLREFKEEKIMEILEIYKVRKMKAIDQEFEEKRESLENDNEIINRYKEIVNTFQAYMDEFVNEEKVKASGFIMQTPYFDNYRYELNRPKINELFDDINKERTDKFQELDRLIDEVKAMISIVPKDGNYDAKVVEILKNYEILDKKGKINA